MTKSLAAPALVGAILLIAVVVRVAYVEGTSYRAINDAGSYNRLGGMIARTGDYDTGSRPGSGAGGSIGPTAYFPPGFPYFLAAVDLLDGHQAAGKTAIEPERIAQAAIGTVVVALIGLVALEAFGESVALICMALAALYPVLIELSGTLVAENLMLVFELAAVWTALRARRALHPYAWIAATGMLTGLATLTHQNAIVIAIPLAFAAVAAARAARGSAWRRSSRPTTPGRPISAVALLAATTALTIAPWTIRNAIELHHFVPVSDETGITLVGTYNPDSAAFKAVPYKWRFFWKIGEDSTLRRQAGSYSEVALGSKLESQTLHYIGAHPVAPLQVAYHNTLRMFELEGTYAWHASAYAIGLHARDAAVGVVAFWLVCLAALLGIFTRAARAAPRWIWAIPVLLALTVVFVNVETPRFREPVDPFLLLLAGCAVDAALRRLGLLHRPVVQARRPFFYA